MKPLPLLILALAMALTGGTAGKDLGDPRPIPAAHWDTPFRPGSSTLVGSYTSIIRRGDGDFVAFNNTVSGDLDGGLQMWEGTDHSTFEKVGVVFRHEAIDDVFGKDGELYPKRRLTRPFIDWHPRVGFVGIVHVCADYGPIDGRVYPALVTSKTGAAGTWRYHGKLKGEIWEAFGDNSGKPKWADGGGFFYQHNAPAELDPARPMQHRYLFFSNQYAGPGGIALLYSADGKTWHFHRDEAGAIANLTPMLAGKTMIFPHIVPMGEHGWSMFLSEKWPPVAIYRLWSPDGIQWQLFGEQPELPKPEELMIKNINGWYDAQTGLLHGFLSVWADQPDGSQNYDKYHAVTKQLQPPKPQD